MASQLEATRLQTLHILADVAVRLKSAGLSAPPTLEKCMEILSEKILNEINKED